MENKWIMHVDGDAFFASCEVSRRPDLFGKPVVVGEERGIATALTYSAKALGVKRGDPIFKIKKEYPKVVILSSHFELYRKFCHNLKQILTKYVDEYETYSIDECFAVISGTESEVMDKVYKMKNEVEKKLGITYSFGVSTTKTLAKVASKRNKPAGVCFLFSHSQIIEALKTTSIESVWGIGYATQKRLRAKNINTAYDYINFDLHSIRRDTILDSLHAPHMNTQDELFGIRHYEVAVNNPTQKSIQATRSFIKKTNKRREILSELSRNLESACSQAREMGLYTDRVFFYVRSERGDKGRYKSVSDSIELRHFTNTHMSIYKFIEQSFDNLIIDEGIVYRSSGIVLSNLRLKEDMMQDLFGEQETVIQEENKITNTIDEIRKKFGYSAIQSLSSLDSNNKRDLETDKRDGKDNYIYGLPYPFMGIIKV